LVDVFSLHAPVPYGDGRTLYEIIRTTNASKTLEVGFAYGLSTLFICQALADNGGGSHTAIDPVESTVWGGLGLRNIEKAGFRHMVRFFEACSHEVLPRLLAEREQFDFIFIDGYHVFDAVLLDFYYADRLVKPGAYIMFHDIWMPSVRKAIAFILRNRAYRLENKFIRERERFISWIVRGIKELWSNPFDLYSSFFLQQCFNPASLVVLQKIADDKRLWDHYQGF